MHEALPLWRVHEIMESWLVQTAHNVKVLGDDFPNYYDPRQGQWALNGRWTEGFWTGILWWLYAYSRDPQFKRWAEKYTRLLSQSKANFADHDLGFLFYHSGVLEYLLTGREEILEPALQAADRLADRYNPHGRFIRAHGEMSDPDRAGYAIIDTVMNLRLLFWAHEQTGQTRLYEVARETALTIGREYVRADGSSFQVVWFDPDTGQVERKATHQGYSPNSCWSRGQAWGIHGFTQVYRYTGEATFKEQAAALGRYFLEHLPEDGVVFYDFDDPAIPNVARDTSAQAIAAAGLLALADLETGQDRRYFLSQAERLLAALCDGYLVEAQEGEVESRGLLKEGCYFLAEERGVHSEIIFGDYYLVEALMRYLSASAWQ